MKFLGSKGVVLREQTVLLVMRFEMNGRRQGSRDRKQNERLGKKEREVEVKFSMPRILPAVIDLIYTHHALSPRPRFETLISTQDFGVC